MMKKFVDKKLKFIRIFIRHMPKLIWWLFALSLLMLLILITVSCNPWWSEYCKNIAYSISAACIFYALINHFDSIRNEIRYKSRDGEIMFNVASYFEYMLKAIGINESITKVTDYQISSLWPNLLSNSQILSNSPGKQTIQDRFNFLLGEMNSSAREKLPISVFDPSWSDDTFVKYVNVFRNAVVSYQTQISHTPSTIGTVNAFIELKNASLNLIEFVKGDDLYGYNLN